MSYRRTRWDMRRDWLTHDVIAYARAFIFLMDCVVKAEPRWPNDHLCLGHKHRPSYAGDGCSVCDELFFATMVSRLDADVPER